MKRTIFTFLVIILITVTFTSVKAQHQFSLEELQSLCLKNANDFETIVLRAGYSFKSEPSSDIVTVFLCDSRNADRTQNRVSRTKLSNQPVNVAFGTTDKQYYINLKTVSLTKSNGWTFVKAETVTPSKWYYYTNGKYEVILCSFIAEINEPTWYYVQYHLVPK